MSEAAALERPITCKAAEVGELMVCERCAILQEPFWRAPNADASTLPDAQGASVRRLPNYQFRDCRREERDRNAYYILQLQFWDVGAMIGNR